MIAVQRAYWLFALSCLACGRVDFQRLDGALDPPRDGAARDAAPRDAAPRDAPGLDANRDSSVADSGRDASTPGGAISISAGTAHSCASTANGTLWGWGDGTDGAIGPIVRVASTPEAIDALNDWSEVVCNELGGCGLRGGELRCWGGNGDGQVGAGDLARHLAPVPVVDVSGLTRVQTRFVTACAIDAGGALYCWGDNLEGQLGQDDSAGAPDSPRPIRVGTGTYRAVSAGQGHTCAIDTSGALWCWGRNVLCELGLGGCDPEQFRSPQRVGIANDWTHIEAGQGHTCGIRSPNALFCWGDNNAGQVGRATGAIYASPVRVDTAEWVTVSVNTFHSCGIQTDGSLWCWGRNQEGQLGAGVFDDNRMTPSRVPGPADWVSVSTGRFHTCGVRSDDSMWCTGANDDGRVGDGTTDRSASFVRVAFPRL
jgi:alpha-tubulin suppressor-like RCC1 family protein